MTRLVDLCCPGNPDITTTSYCDLEVQISTPHPHMAPGNQNSTERFAAIQVSIGRDWLISRRFEVVIRTLKHVGYANKHIGQLSGEMEGEVEKRIVH